MSNSPGPCCELTSNSIVFVSNSPGPYLELTFMSNLPRVSNLPRADFMSNLPRVSNLPRADFCV